MEQGSAQWLAARAGHVTASRLKDVMAKGKSGEAAVRRGYRVQLVTERLTGLPQESYKNAAMEHGTEMEPQARMAYEAVTGNMVFEKGFIKHPEIDWLGASPDGLVDSAGGVEIKCPFNSAVHVETLSSGMPTEHTAQVQGCMWVTGRDWWDFISFDPRMPAHLRLYVERIARDGEYIKGLEKAVSIFLTEVDAMTKQLMERDQDERKAA